MKYFIVNQKKTYAQEKEGGYIWAPIYTKNGRIQSHWESLTEVQQGDIIFSNRNGKLVSLNIAKDSCFECNNPFATDDWKTEGRKVELDYYPLPHPISYTHYIDDLLALQTTNGAFNKSKHINQGYLYSLTKYQFELLFSLVKESLPKCVKETILSDKNEDYQEFATEQAQFDEINLGTIPCYSKEELDQLYEKRRDKKPKLQTNSHHRYVTDPKLKATCLQQKNYICEIDSNHHTFSNTTGLHQYMECHHLIPMSAQKDFNELWLDDLFNLVCLCPRCHAQIHYGNTAAKEEIFWTIYNQRKQAFSQRNLNRKQMEKIFQKYYL